MIRYTLKCDNDHSFESWFQSAEAFEKLKAAGMVACSICGSDKVEKAVMAPRLRTGRDAARAAAGKARQGPLSAPASAAEQALRDLRAKIEANSENVGSDFAREARAIHEGDAPERSIYGEARADEARKLVEDGIPVAPLPWQNRRGN
ncbi:MAG: DUF1178 family protein [Rhodobacteraceae bacterium]|nr:DUF1178 family protein [Paracoccaceae bacterium]